MSIPKLALEVPRKKTKIVATVSDKGCDVQFIKDLYKNGLDVVRLNTAHQELADAKKVIDLVRQVSPRIAIMVDTKGPEVRTGVTDCVLNPEEKDPNKIQNGIRVKAGDKVHFRGAPGEKFDDSEVTVSYPYFTEEVPVDSKVLVDDGELQFIVTGKDNKRLVCIALNDGVVKNKKSINVPNVQLSLPALTPKDKEFIRFAAKENLDFIAHSFVRRKDDLIAIKAILAETKSTRSCKLISKIENQEGVDNIKEILEHCHGIMVARGDLAVEIPRERIPAIQKRLVKKCIKKRKPVIVATQMLHSMMDNPSPTRAEVSDVANAVFDEADAVMLSGETANGKYPIESIKMMNDIAVEVEKELPSFLDGKITTLNTVAAAHLSKAAVDAANSLKARAIFSDTGSGRTCRNLAGFRGNIPIYGLCYNDEVVRTLTLTFGVTPYRLSANEFTTSEYLEGEIANICEQLNYADEDIIVIISGNFGTKAGASYIGVATVADLKRKVKKAAKK